MQKVQDIMLVSVQMVQERSGERCRGCKSGQESGAGCLRHLHRHERYTQCTEVQGVQAHLRSCHRTVGASEGKIRKVE